MTINELEQGIRNLVATQPMVMSGSSGEVVNGVLSMIDAFRNLSFKVQTYPYQDILKYNMSSELQKLENNFSSMATSALQERGINILLYVPTVSSSMGSMVNQYGVVQQPIDSNMLMGQMIYQQPQQQRSNIANPYMQNMGQPVRQQVYGTQMRSQTIPNMSQPKQQSYNGGYAGNGNQVPQGQRVVSLAQQKVRPDPRKNSPQTVVKQNPKPAVQKEQTPVNNIERKQENQNADNYPEVGTGKSAGRDYLMELLKK